MKKKKKVLLLLLSSQHRTSGLSVKDLTNLHRHARCRAHRKTINTCALNLHCDYMVEIDLLLDDKSTSK